MDRGQVTNHRLERLRAIQAETKGIDARISALESGYAFDAQAVDDYIASLVPARPAAYSDFLSEKELNDIAVRHNAALNKGVDCDALDYALAALSGVISGLLDVLFTSKPGEGVVSEKIDGSFEAIVIKFAKSFKDENGNQCWKPRSGNENSFKSAVGFLEGKFRVGYDQATSKAIDSAVKHLSPDNHHAKSAAHYPDIIGLVASICNQFTDTSTFYGTGQGHLVFVAGTGNGGELKGDTLSAKIFAGFINWLGHCMSDVAGSSGSKSRGQGLPIPFTELFQLCDFGRFPNEKGQWQSLATVMTQVYEQGYDLRHGVATTFPVLVNDLLIRALYVIRRRFADGLAWKECLPKEDCPEVQRMVTVGTGTMCLVDLGHAVVTSWGSWVKFFSQLNLAGWARLGLQGMNELKLIAERENRNILAATDDISEEWDRLLERSRTLLE